MKGIMRIPVKKTTIGIILWTLLFYNFHRYIFKYNSEGTSPTYSDTPLIWKILKYILLILLLIPFYSTQKYKLKARAGIYLILFIVIFLLLINVMQAILYAPFLDELEFILYFAILFPFAFCVQRLSDFEIDYYRFITFGAIVLFLSNFIAIANFFFYGRLPALGYAGGLIRFGGFWDDPNGFSFLCVFLVYYFFQRKKYLLALLAFINLMPAFSFSAYIMLFISMFYWVIVGFLEKDSRWLKLSIGILVVSISIFSYFFIELQEIYELKRESISEHLYRKMTFNLYPLQNGPFQFSEMWYEGFLYNYFPFSLIILGLIFYFFMSLFFSTKRKETAFFFFLFLIGSFFFSMLYIFPINFIFIGLLIDYLKYPGYSWKNATRMQ